MVEDFLRSWEPKTVLDLGRGEMRFQFEDSHVIDRDPLLPGEKTGDGHPLPFTLLKSLWINREGALD